MACFSPMLAMPPIYSIELAWTAAIPFQTCYHPNLFPPIYTAILDSSQSQLYRSLVGALQYLMITRPDISYAINLLCQHLHHPSADHFHLLKKLLRYIKGTTDLALPISPTNLQLTTYTDANCANDPLDRHYTTGFCSFLGSTLISWQVKKKPTIAKSSTEAEYRFLAMAAVDIVWIHRLLQEFQIPQSQPTTLYCDNLFAIALATNPMFHARTKHIEIDYHYIRERIQANDIKVLHVRSQDQRANILTKSLPTSRFQSLRLKLTLQPGIVNLRGGNTAQMHHNHTSRIIQSA